MAKPSDESNAAARPKAPRAKRSKAPADASPPVERAMDVAIGLSSKAMPSADEIRERAYHLYLERGGVDGTEVDDWVRAETELQKS
jgi:hypothetical protein